MQLVYQMDFIRFYHVLIYISYLFLKKKELGKRKIRILLKKSSTLAMIDLVLDVSFEKKIDTRKFSFWVGGILGLSSNVHSLFRYWNSYLVIEYYCFFKSSSTSCFVIFFQASGILPSLISLLWYFSSSFDLKWQTNHFQYGWVDASGVMLHVAYSPPACR